MYDSQIYDKKYIFWCLKAHDNITSIYSIII